MYIYICICIHIIMYICIYKIYIDLHIYLYIRSTAGALTSNDEESEVSELGRLASAMPVDIPLVKLVKTTSTLNSKP